MRKIKDAVIKFMSGRYGTDSFNRFLLWSYIVLAAVNIFIKSLIITAIMLIIATFLIYRSLSKNIYKRSAENRKFISVSATVKEKIKLIKSMWRDRKTHIYKKCPHCKSVIRLPKKPGEHLVDCPKCKTEFKVKI